jgi:hypothetical protein
MSTPLEFPYPKIQTCPSVHSGGKENRRHSLLTLECVKTIHFCFLM